MTGQVGFNGELYARTYRSRHWQLTRPLIYTTRLIGRRPMKMVVPAGFVTDLASIPRAARSLIPQMGRHRLPGALHDYLYSEDSEHDLDRRKVDKIFFEAMVAENVPKWKRAVMYRAVRIGAGNRGRWKRKKSEG